MNQPPDLTTASVQQEQDNAPPHMGSEPHFNWIGSLRFKLGAGLLVLFTILVCSNLWLIWYRGLPLLVQQNKELYNQIGENIVTRLNEQFMQAQTLAEDMANLMETLPPDPNLVKTTIPHLLNLEAMRDVIAGGGIWPEPHAFDPAKQRSSFFWGRAADNQLRFYDDYNKPDTPGYHNEEWYVPAALLPDGQAYWSRSYTDPYSFQPMVTCTVPYYRDDKLQGVTTVDLKLEGVNKLVSERLGGRNGYAFVVDRNNKFISFPDQSMVVTRRQDNNGQPYPDFIYVHELVTNEPRFAPIAEQLDILSQLDSSGSNAETEQDQTIADAIALGSYQIELPEARLIARNLFHKTDGGVNLLERFEVPDDPILHGRSDVAIYHMPSTNWKVVTVFPMEDSIQAALSISKSVTWGSLTIILVWGLACVLFLWRTLFARLQEMTDRIRLSARDGREVPLQQNASDELGLLATWYNRRTRQLHQALKSAEVSAQNLKRENNEHRTTARLLERSVALQRAILDSANLAILTLDKDGRILSCNAGTRKILGYGEQDLGGKVFPAGMIGREQLERYQHVLQERYDIVISGFKLFTMALEHADRSEDEWIFTCSDGRSLEVLLSVTAVVGQQQAIEGWLAVVSDNSQRNRPRREGD